jgi:tetratricopeptide (TPR) repeat protein
MRFVTMMRISLLAIGLALLPVAAPLQGVPEAAAQQDATDPAADKEARKAAREAEKAAKKAEAEAKKAAKKAEAEAKKAARDAERQAKKEEAAAKKAAKKEAEEAKKAAKKEAEEAKKAAKKEAEEAKKTAKKEAEEAKKEAEEAKQAAKEETAAGKAGCDARNDARALSRRGLKHYGNREYDQAIECFNRAYELDPLPEHQFNLGYAYKRKGDKRSAYESFQKFLVANPRDASMRDEATDNADELKHYIDAEDALLVETRALKAQAEQAQRETAQLHTSHDEAMSQKNDELETIRQDLEKARTTQVSQQQHTVSGSGAGGGKRTAGAAMLAAGGVALGAAIFSGLEARSADRKLDDLGPNDTFNESRVWLHERGEAAQKRMLIFSLTGAALAAGGAVVYYLGERDARRPSQLERGPVAITPAVSASGAGIQVSGSF